MRLRWTLVLTWLAFAVLATAAGFAAVGLVGQGLEVAAAPAPPAATASQPSSGGATTAESAARTASRSVRGNYVSAACRGNSVTLSASPAPGWSLDDYRPGPGREARARFRSTSGEVEFKVSCSGGRPVFETEDDPDKSGDD